MAAIHESRPDHVPRPLDGAVWNERLRVFERACGVVPPANNPVPHPTRTAARGAALDARFFVRRLPQALPLTPELPLAPVSPDEAVGPHHTPSLPRSLTGIDGADSGKSSGNVLAMWFVRKSEAVFM